jgi:hypothetical protein
MSVLVLPGATRHCAAQSLALPTMLATDGAS